MLWPHRLLFSLGIVAWSFNSASADTTVVTESSAFTTHFDLQKILPPAVDDLAAKAKFILVDGQADANSASLDCLRDGKIPTSDDQPTANFFFAPGTSGGRIAVDLGELKSIGEIATYSWHNSTRAPQVYTVYGAVGEEPQFILTELKSQDPLAHGWAKIARVDTRSANGNAGQHAAQISDAAGHLGRYRYLLFAIEATERNDPFGNTFFSEIDVLDASAPKPQRIAVPELKQLRFTTADGRYRFMVDCTQAPALIDWTEQKLKPVIQDWYPKIVELLPSEGFQAPGEVTFRYQPGGVMQGIPAYAQGAVISMNAPWMQAEQNREAVGAVVHEMVHVVQAYQRNPRNRGRRGPPGWIVEGVPDYVRWFLYEPQTKGAELSPQALAKAKHDASYRVSANFIDYVIRKHDPNLLQKLNAAVRDGRYSTELWQQWTGKNETELADAWRSGK